MKHRLNTDRIKVGREYHTEDEAQLLNELKATGLEDLVGEVEPVVKEFHFALLKLEDANLDENHPDSSAQKEALYMRDTVIAAMDDVRETADRLEKLVADDLWPLPEYSEMLFIK